MSSHNIYFCSIFACSLAPGALLRNLKISCRRLGLPPRKIILVIYSTFSRELFHHIKNFPGLDLDTATTKWLKNSGPGGYIPNLNTKTLEWENKLLSFPPIPKNFGKITSEPNCLKPGHETEPSRNYLTPVSFEGHSSQK